MEEDLEIPSPRTVLLESPLPQVVVLVDPLSTGVLLQRKVLETGLYKVVIVWSDRSQPTARAKHFVRGGYPREAFTAVLTHEANHLEETLQALLAATNNMNIVAVMCGSEFGVVLEDQIANGLNAKLGVTYLKGSGIPNVQTKIDKHIQANLIRAAGLNAVRETLARTEDDVQRFLKMEQPPGSTTAPTAFVVKPQTGAGSVGVTFCNSEQAVKDAFHTILAGEHKAHVGDKYRHYSEAGVLIQEYLAGTEYIVNAVVRNGVVKTTAMWKYDKRPYNGASFLCFSKELQVVSDEHCEEILEYTEKVLHAIGFQSGAIHAEIMYTNRGPVLVEVNCRLHGGNGAWVTPAHLCMGYDQLSILVDVYLNNGKVFDTLPSKPLVSQNYCHQVKMRSHVQGILKCVIPSQWERIQALPSYYEHFFTVQPGDKILISIDMPSIPGEITLIHKDKDVLAADYALLNEILAEGIFQV
jgi:biotin carboxylase